LSFLTIKNKYRTWYVKYRIPVCFS
jgi:hypothetical protein